jgi:hypothetical protein
MLRLGAGSNAEGNAGRHAPEYQKPRLGQRRCDLARGQQAGCQALSQFAE